MNAKRILRWAGLSCLLGAAFVGSAWASGAAGIPADSLVVFRGNVSPLAKPEFDRGPADPSLPMERMILALQISPEKRAELDQLLGQQQDPASPLYHQWLTPEEFGARFGPSSGDVQALADWLKAQGFAIESVAKSHLWINFTGTVVDVERAFHTQIHDYFVDGYLRHANATDPSIPGRFEGVAAGIVTLHNFPRKALHTPPRRVASLRSEYTDSTSGDHYLAPGDYTTIYNLGPVYGSGYTGSGVTIAISGRTHMALSDITSFRSTFGLPSNNPTYIINGPDPGDQGAGEDGEADLDVEWSGAVAYNAAIKFVCSASTSSTDGVDLSAQYIVDNNIAPVMSTSFGQCEQNMGSTENSFYNNLWSQAAAEGITSFVSAGDSSASGCDSADSSTGSGRGVNGLASTPYNVCVGGTEFNDFSNPNAYWSSSNDAYYASALSYIPEEAWNESGAVSGGSGLWGTGGGASVIYSKPSWQVATGVPSDAKRDCPDISLTAAGHDGYFVATQGDFYTFGGTSASSPSFAGLMALIVQKTGQRQGNANTRFYQLGAAQYGGGGATVYHDTTVGNNSVPGVTGFNCTIGYDQATGLGSVDASALLSHWAGGGCSTITVSPASLPAGSVGIYYSVNFTQSGGSGSITWSLSGALPTGLSFNAGSGSLSGSPSQTGGFPITVTAKDSNNCTGNQNYTLTVSNGCSITLNPSSLPAGTLNQPYGPVTFTQSGGSGTITWIESGALPSGITFNVYNQTLSGTPSQTGNFSFSITAHDSNNCQGSMSYFLQVRCPTITISPSSLPDGAVGVAYSQNLTATGGSGAYSFTVSSGATPTGLTLNPSGLLSGSPTSAGTFSFTVTATDGIGCASNQSYTMNVTVYPPQIGQMLYASGPFRFIAKGANFQNGIRVLINNVNWPNVQWKNLGKIIIGGGKSLKLAVPKGVVTTFTFVNPDGGTATWTGYW